MRGVVVDHATMQRWVYKFTPFEGTFKKRHKHVGNSWSMDETYIKVKGKWVSLYRAVDKDDTTIDFLLTKRTNKFELISFLQKPLVTMAVLK